MKTFGPFRALPWIAINIAMQAGAQNLGRPFACGETSPAGYTEAARWLNPSGPERVESLPDAPVSVIGVQEPVTLELRDNAGVHSKSSVPLDALCIPTIHRRFVRGDLSGASGEQLKNEIQLVSASYREPAKSESTGQCTLVALAVNRRIFMNPTSLLDIVAEEVGANPDCCCEIVKSAIEASDAQPARVVEIVDTAIHSSPENMRIISQCAIAVSPESLSALQALLAMLDPQGGDEGTSSKSTSTKSSKSAKSAKDIFDEVEQIKDRKPDVNPLDLPPVLFLIPPPIIPPPVTRVDS